MKHQIRAISIAITAGLLAAPLSRAAEGGYSNYVPGTYGDFGLAMEPPGKLTLRNDVYYYTADTSRVSRNGNLQSEVELTFMLNMTTILYKPEVQVFDAQYAFGTLIPVIHVEFDASVGDLSLSADTTGLGDITLVPGILFWNHGKAHMSLAQYVIAPTGEYSVNDDVNPGLNYWSFDTNFAFTWLDEEKGQEFSFNLGHIYNTENGDTNYQTGQEIHLDVAINQYLSETLAVGLQGFYLNQITGDSGSGAILGDYKARVSGIGPTIMWGRQIKNQDVTFIAKWLHEFDAENRLEGDHFFLSVAMDW